MKNTTIRSRYKVIKKMQFVFLVVISLFGFLNISMAQNLENEISEKSDRLKDATQLADLLKQTMTYQADFKQSVFRDDAVAPDVTTGRFLINRPNHFKWQTLTSYEQLIIADGDHLWTYDPDLEQVTIQNQSAVLANSPLLLLTSGVEALMKSFDIQRIKNTLNSSLDKDDLLFLLKPKENSLFESVHILIQNKNIKELFLTDSLGSKTSVEFSNILRNEKISVQEFIFETPKGTDVIDSRETL